MNETLQRSIAMSLGIVFAAGSLTSAGCAGVKSQATSGPGGGSGSPAPTAGAGGGMGGSSPGTGGIVGTGGSSSPDAGPPPITDLPPDPIIVSPAPTNAPGLFSTAPRSAGAPCILSPEVGTLMPRNWLRPQFTFTPAADENLFEITLAVTGFVHPLVVYTTSTSYTLDANIWSGLRVSINDQSIAVTVRALTLSGTGSVQNPPSPLATSSFTIAPVDAPGKIVYWANPGGTTSGDGYLRGFGIGEESTEAVLVGSQVSASARNTTQDTCIGCHSATPDGLSVGFVFGPPTSMIGLDTYYDTMADIQTATVGNVPSVVSTASVAAIRLLRGIPAYSKSHWAAGDHIVLLTDANNAGTLIWVELDSASGAQGVVARQGDARGATEPAFSHDGTRIVYVSSAPSTIHDGRLDTGPADLYVVPYQAGAGGTATALTGAADGANTHYYPSFSPDDLFLAYTYAAGNGTAYSNPDAEIFVVGATGGQPTRFAANDPPSCQTSVHSPGITNDWPKWAPEATTAGNGKTYYWVTFSSTRSGTPQLYVAPMTVTGGAVAVGYPALYLWNQPPSEHNHTPSWDDYQIPPIVIDRP
jgi:hypothetical protein